MKALVIAAVAALTLGGAAAHATEIDYTFGPGSTYDFVGYLGYDYIITGGFQYDTSNGAVTNVDYTTTAPAGTFTFNTATAKSPEDVVFSGNGGADELFFASSLAAGGVDLITGGADATGSGFTIAATGSVLAPTAVSAAPEPTTWALMFLGIGGIGLMMRQAKRKMGFRFKDALAA